MPYIDGFLGPIEYEWYSITTESGRITYRYFDKHNHMVFLSYKKKPEEPNKITIGQVVVGVIAFITTVMVFTL
jgi:hypothetical protein